MRVLHSTAVAICQPESRRIRAPSAADAAVLLELDRDLPMALPIAAPERRLQHRRSIDVQVYSRGNGLWEVDARLTDTRSRTVNLATGPRAAGDPIHDMLLRLVVDERFNVVEAGAESMSVPYPGNCDEHGDVYQKLVGLNLMQRFRETVRARVGGVQGCTHITELAQVLPTAVVQAFAGEVIDTRGDSDSSERPFQIDRCHALRSDGPAVLAFYPRWYRPPAPAAANTESERARTP